MPFAPPPTPSGYEESKRFDVNVWFPNSNRPGMSFQDKTALQVLFLLSNVEDAEGEPIDWLVAAMNSTSGTYRLHCVWAGLDARIFIKRKW